MPKISIIMASYNHEKFINDAIQSVLQQTFQDFELIIVDDGSSDNSVAVINSFNDPRIKLIPLTINQGQFIATNIGLQNATGEYTGILNSDDAFVPTKLEKQIAFLEKNPQVAAVFSDAEIIDENNRPLRDKNNLYTSIFKQANRSRHAWLNYFFFYGNCLCHPSALIRTKCHEEIGYYDPRFANCADFQFWIQVVANYDIHIFQEKLTHFRIHKKNGNMSGNSFSSQKRMRWEDYQAKLLFFDGLLSEDDFFMAFPEAKTINQKDGSHLTNFLLAQLALKSNDTYLQALGLDVLFNMMKHSNVADLLIERYHFSHKDLIKLTGQVNPFQMSFSFSKIIKAIMNRIFCMLSSRDCKGV